MVVVFGEGTNFGNKYGLWGGGLRQLGWVDAAVKPDVSW
jgi:hypothetical protein